jgi:hypothetical protein
MKMKETRNILNVKRTETIYDVIVAGKNLLLIIIISWLRYYASSLNDAG